VLDTFSNSSLLLVYSYCHVHQYCLFILFLLILNLTSPAAYNVVLLCCCNSPYFLPYILIHFISFLLISPFFMIMEFWRKSERMNDVRMEGGSSGWKEEKINLRCLYTENVTTNEKIDIYRYHQQQWIEISFEVLNGSQFWRVQSAAS